VNDTHCMVYIRNKIVMPCSLFIRQKLDIHLFVFRNVIISLYCPKRDITNTLTYSVRKSTKLDIANASDIMTQANMSIFNLMHSHVYRSIFRFNFFPTIQRNKYGRQVSTTKLTLAQVISSRSQSDSNNFRNMQMST
jgi:hypothetical protein